MKYHHLRYSDASTFECTFDCLARHDILNIGYVLGMTEHSKHPFVPSPWHWTSTGGPRNPLSHSCAKHELDIVEKASSTPITPFVLDYLVFLSFLSS